MSTPTLLGRLSPLPFLLLVACRRDPNSVPPPPIERGSCLVSRWVGGQAADQTCRMGGYAWHCVTDVSGQDPRAVCDRGPEVSEVPTMSAAPPR